jgi:hypothetical protein
MRVWKERFELLDSTIAPTQTPIDLVDQYHDTPRLRESRSFDADEQYWYISFDVVISVLVCCFALLIFYGVYAYARKTCWRCQRAVEGSEQRQCCHTGRDASRAQRVGLVVWLVIAVVVFAVLTVMTQHKLDNTLKNLHDGVNDLGDAFDAIDAQTASLDEIGVETLATAQEIFCVSQDFETLIQDASEDFAAAAADAAEIAASAATDANKLGSRLKGHGRWLDLALLVLLAFVVLILPCASYGALTKSPRLLEHWAARWACFVVACLAVLLAFEFGVLVKVSDFCVAPDANFRDLVDRRIAISSADAELIDYYVSCGGANPLLAPLNNSLAEITFLDDAAALALATGACAPSQSLEELRVLMAAADAQLDAVQTAAACDAVTPIYQDLVHDTLCRKFVRSLNAMGVSHAVVGVALYVFLYAANYVSETILLEAERRDMKAQVGGERSLEDAVARGRIQSLEDDFRASQSRGEETKEDFSRPSQHYFSGWSVGGSAYTGTDPVA